MPRRGEICGLRWSDVDLGTCTVTIRRGVVDVAGRLVVKDTKTHAERALSIDSGTVAMLRAYRSKVDDRVHLCDLPLASDAYVLPELPDGSKPIRPDKATMVFRRLRGAVGLRDDAPARPTTSSPRR
ncbi:MAG: hypothetical protein ACRD29_12850 [Acidimicrobiales bacterium]